MAEGLGGWLNALVKESRATKMCGIMEKLAIIKVTHLIVIYNNILMKKQEEEDVE